MWIDGLLDSLYDLDIWLPPWTWPWFLKVNFEISVLGMDGAYSFEFDIMKPVGSDVGKKKWKYISIFFTKVS